MNRLKKGDRVRVISGSEKGKEGTILKVLINENKAQVEGVNIHKKHQRANNQNQEAKIIDITLPINLSNLTLIDNKSKGKSTKVKYGFDKNNKKIRIAKLSNTEIGSK